LRRVRCIRGEVAMRMDFVPRLEYGLIHPLFSARPGGVLTRGGAGTLMLSTSMSLHVEAGAARGLAVLGSGDELCLAVEYTEDWQRTLRPWTPKRIRAALKDTERGWASWSRRHQSYQGPFREQVWLSGLVMQALTYRPTGAIVAAPTTSLPEGQGTGRTWDYRYCWVRDANMTLRGLWVAACPQEAGRYFHYLSPAAATLLDRNRDLQIMFGIGGERDLSERELSHLRGWRGSAPVRVGNAAWQQRQLDVYGALLDAAYQLWDQIQPVDDATRRFLIAAVDAAADRWREDDCGIWEIRCPARPYLHSTLLCWVALDRGVALAAPLHAGTAAERWRTERDALRAAILSRGWNSQAGMFTQTLDNAELDASVLMIALVGFLQPDDPRLRSIVDAIATGLSDERGLLYRYRSDDGLTGDEGPFLLCTFWLAEALAVLGEVDRARRTLELAAAFASPLGLFAEQVAPDTDELLGNYPQAFSLLGLVNAAWALARALDRRQP
jgi:GH15 family glucan-1,4-alpha-glucosidase